MLTNPLTSRTVMQEVGLNVYKLRQRVKREYGSVLAVNIGV